MSEDTEGRNLHDRRQGHIFPGGLLWHFTPPGTLLSILRDGLRATHSSCLSDRLDCAVSQRMQQLLFDMVKKQHECAGDPLPHEQEAPATSFFEKGLLFNAFIACFSFAPDFEMSWERYTPQGGFAIGFEEEAILGLRTFSRKSLSAVADSSHSANSGSAANPWILVQCCEYKHPLSVLTWIRNRRNDILTKMSDLYKNQTQESLTRYCEEQAKEIVAKSTELLFSKRKQFEWEHEFRVAVMYGNDIPKDSLHHIAETNKTFVNLSFQDEPKNVIRKIIVSPNGNVGENHKHARLIATTFGIEENCIALAEDEIQQFDHIEGPVR